MGLRQLQMMVVLLLVGCSSSKPKMDWQQNKDDLYPPNVWITAIGSGMTDQDAKDQAMVNLSRVFSSEIDSDVQNRQILIEYFDNKESSFEEKQEYSADIRIRSDLKLMNVRILEEKQLANGSFIALAGLNRSTSSLVYEEEHRKIMQDIDQHFKILPTEISAFNKLKRVLKIEQQMKLARTFESKLAILNGYSVPEPNSNTYTSSYNETKQSLKNVATIRIQGLQDVALKNTIIEVYEEYGFRYVENADNPMIRLDIHATDEPALNNRQDAIFFMWKLDIQHLDPSGSERYATFTLRERSGSTTEQNARQRMDLDRRNMIKKELPKFIETELLQ